MGDGIKTHCPLPFLTAATLAWEATAPRQFSVPPRRVALLVRPPPQDILREQASLAGVELELELVLVPAGEGWEEVWVCLVWERRLGALVVGLVVPQQVWAPEVLPVEAA